MYATQVMIGMTLLRIVLPVVALLALGELANRQQRGNFYTK